MNELRSVSVVAPVLFVLACGGPEASVTLSGRMHGLASTPGTFELGVDVAFSADDILQPE
jgi:hypothetical protein